MITTIQLEEKLKDRLDKMKIHPREAYGKVIERLIENESEEEELSPQTIKEIEEALDDIKKGRVYSHEEVKRRLKIR